MGHASDDRSPARNFDHTHCHGRSRGSSWFRVHRQSGAQYHWPHQHRSRSQCQADGNVCRTGSRHETRRRGLQPQQSGHAQVLRETEDAVRKLNRQGQVVNAQTSDEFERAFAQLSAESVDGVVLLADPTIIEHSRRIAELAQSARLPTAFQRRANVGAGGLSSYGRDQNYQLRQAAFYVDRILKGEKPAELPVMQPTKIELVINLKTAKALGLTVPLIMQMTADEVIE